MNGACGLLRDYTGRGCNVQEIVQPANPGTMWAVREILMLDAKQRVAGSSPAGGTSFMKHLTASAWAIHHMSNCHYTARQIWTYGVNITNYTFARYPLGIECAHLPTSINY